jgi:hypothetical protein
MSNDREDRSQENDRLETDSEKIIRRHIENEDDAITEEDIRNVRIEPSEAAVESANDPVNLGEPAETETDGTTGADADKIGKSPANPWDVID